MSDLIDRQQAIEAICMETCGVSLKNERCMVHCTEVQAVEKLPPAEPMVDIRDTQYNLPVGTDTISRAKAIDAIDEIESEIAEGFGFDYEKWRKYFCDLPPAQPKKEIAKRVLWTGWKGYRDTRYKCPNCKKPVKNDDIHCHRCGQKLMFPHISFTDYVPGEKQETIVRWDDE